MQLARAIFFGSLATKVSGAVCRDVVVAAAAGRRSFCVWKTNYSSSLLASSTSTTTKTTPPDVFADFHAKRRNLCLSAVAQGRGGGRGGVAASTQPLSASQKTVSSSEISESPVGLGYHEHRSGDDVESNRRITKDVLDVVKSQIAERSHGRLFAVISLNNKQFKITDEDLVAIQCDFPAEIGSRVVLEKVLLVGGRDFTLIGRPLLPKDTVRIEATLLERTLTHRYIWFFMIKRKKYRRMKFYQFPLSVLRINSIELSNKTLE